MRPANRAEPVTLVRSPMFTNSVSGRMLRGSSPDSRQIGATSAGTRGGRPDTAAASARMCRGVVPQQPPTTFTNPDRANSPTNAAISGGVWSYPPKALGNPALGWQLTAMFARRDSSSTYGRSCAAPSAQFSPIVKRSACRTEFQNASTVCPDSVRPLASVIVPDTIRGTSRPRSSSRLRTANSAALQLSVSKMVSTMSRSTPPSSRASTCVR